MTDLPPRNDQAELSPPKEGGNGGLIPEKLRDAFASFGNSAPRLFFAPGRINLIGAHLDYNGGTVLPVPIQQGTYAAIALRQDHRIRLKSLDFVEEFDLDGEALPPAAELGWAAYPVGVWLEAREMGHPLLGFDLVVGGDLTRGAGLSSSASLEVVMGLALMQCAEKRVDLEEVALLGFRAENGYVGVKCGIMDQFASALGESGKALYLDCATREHRHVPLGTDMEILVLDTHKPRELVDSEFNRRVEQCHEALAVLRVGAPERAHLAAFSLEEVEKARPELGPLLYKRARHVVTEVARIERAVCALERGDLPAFGRLVHASHESCRDDYEVSCPELDFLVEGVCGVEGVLGGRLTGAGFGGCLIALAQPGAFGPSEERALAEEYHKAFGRPLGVQHLLVGDAPHELD
jgi:galactokinase